MLDQLPLLKGGPAQEGLKLPLAFEVWRAPYAEVQIGAGGLRENLEERIDQGHLKLQTAQGPLPVCGLLAE